ncbi:MAG: SCO family protein [Abitibacteriaceae bacterium]|nr:SCO family protein [Abditibacteriaceae bacterium]
MMGMYKKLAGAKDQRRGGSIAITRARHDCVAILNPRSSIFSLLILILISSVAPLWAHEAQDDLPDDIIKKIGFDQKLDQQVPLDLNFRDDTGKDVRFQQYFGKKPVMVVPLYYKCGMLCPEEMKLLIDSLKELKFDVGKDFQLVVLSIDPRETPADAANTKKDWLKQYGRAGTEAGWHLLTGQQTAIGSLTQAIGFRYAFDAKTGQYAHPDGVVILTPEGKVARYFYSLNYPSRDLRFALVEASKNQIGSPVDYLWLQCYHYNPVTGKYSIGVLALVRLGALLTMVGLGSLIGGLSLWSKRQQGQDVPLKQDKIPGVVAELK